MYQIIMNNGILVRNVFNQLFVFGYWLENLRANFFSQVQKRKGQGLFYAKISRIRRNLILALFVGCIVNPIILNPLAKHAF